MHKGCIKNEQMLQEQLKRLQDITHGGNTIEKESMVGDFSTSENEIVFFHVNISIKCFY